MMWQRLGIVSVVLIVAVYGWDIRKAELEALKEQHATKMLLLRNTTHILRPDMSSTWMNNGALVVDESGVVLCDSCPCDESTTDPPPVDCCDIPTMIVEDPTLSNSGTGCLGCPTASVLANRTLSKDSTPYSGECSWSGPAFTVCSDEGGTPEGQWILYRSNDGNYTLIIADTSSTWATSTEPSDCENITLDLTSPGSECIGHPTTITVSAG